MSPSGGIEPQEFKNVLQQLQITLPMPLERFAKDLFSIYDDDDSGTVDFRELICCISTITKGSLKERLHLCFKLYDKDNSGFLDGKELVELSNTLLKNYLTNKANRRRNSSLMLTPIMSMDTNKDGLISFDEFYNGIKHDDVLLKCFGIAYSPQTNEDDVITAVNKALHDARARRISNTSSVCCDARSMCSTM